jgi:lipopolysaccharide export system protein LptC
MEMARSLAQGVTMQNDRPGDIDNRFARAERGRSRAFKAAAQHSARVKNLRRYILGGAALTTLGVIGYSWLRPLDGGDTHFSLESFGISGDKVTMEHPKLTGVRRDGRPYEVTADSGVQNPHDPSRTTLNKLDARLRLSDDGETRVLGDRGVYDSNSQTLDLAGHVHIKGASYDLAMQTASMNFKTNALSSNTPVRLDMDAGWIQADSMTMTDNGEQITFLGNVQSLFKPAPEEGAPATDRKDD